MPSYPQRLCPCPPWQHPPWTRIAAPWLPMSLLQAPGGHVCAQCGRFPCFGAPKWHHKKWENTQQPTGGCWLGNATGSGRAERSFTRRLGRQVVQIKKWILREGWGLGFRWLWTLKRNNPLKDGANWVRFLRGEIRPQQNVWGGTYSHCLALELSDG